MYDLFDLVVSIYEEYEKKISSNKNEENISNEINENENETEEVYCIKF